MFLVVELEKLSKLDFGISLPISSCWRIWDAIWELLLYSAVSQDQNSLFAEIQGFEE